MFQENTLVLPCWSKICLKLLCLLRFQRYLRFFIFRKNSIWSPRVVKIELFHISTKDSYTILWVQNLLEIALLWFKRYFWYFIFWKNSRWLPNFFLNLKFSCFNTILSYYHVGPKFALTVMTFEIFAILYFVKKLSKKPPWWPSCIFFRHSE